MVEINIYPQNEKLEKDILGTIIQNDYLNKAANILKADCFYKEEHRLMFMALERFAELRRKPTIIGLDTALKGKQWYRDAGGTNWLISLTETLILSGFFEENCKILYEIYAKRELMMIGMSLYDKATATDPFELREEAEKRIKDMGIVAGGSITAYDMDKSVKDYFQEIKEGKHIGIPTGFAHFDQHTMGGMQKSDLIVLGSYSSNGKTATAMNIITHAGSRGYCGKVYTFEQSLKQLYMRQIAILSQRNTREIILNRLYELPVVQDAMTALKHHRTLYDFRPSFIDDWVLDVRIAVKRQGVQYVIVDYLQLMRSRYRDKTESMSYIANRMKELATELDIPIVAISQLRRPVEKSKAAPNMSMLKESGDIENAADIVWLPWIPIAEPTELLVVDVDGVDEATSFEDQRLMLHRISKGRNYGVTKWKTWIDNALRITDNKPQNLFFNNDIEDKETTPF